MSLSPIQPASPTLDHVLAQLKGVSTSLRGWGTAFHGGG